MFGEFSRYKHAVVYQDDDDRLYQDMRETLDYVSGEETLHNVVAGDTLQSLALRYFSGLPGGASLWWVIADFQPEPIVDPTVDLVEGDWLAIPSVAHVQLVMMRHGYGEGSNDL